VKVKKNKKKKEKNMRNNRTQEMIVYAMFIAILAILSFTPLGYFSLGGVSITLVHIVVLIAAFLLGLKGGIIIGLLFGIFSMLRAWVAPNAIADYIFRNPLVSVLPRVLFGLLAGAFAELLKKVSPKNALYIASGSIGVVVVGLAIIYFTSSKNTLILQYVVPIAAIVLLIGAILLIVFANKTKGKSIDQVAMAGLCGVSTFVHTAMVLPLMFYFGMSNPDTAVAFGDLTFGALFGGTLAANGIVEIVLAVIIVPVVVFALRKVYHPIKKEKGEVHAS